MTSFRVFVLGLLLCMMADSAWAWEFSMSGKFVYQYRYATQLGRNGFFGPFDTPSPLVGSGTGNEQLNFWHGRVFDSRISNTVLGTSPEITSSSDTATRAFWMDIHPEIRINKAVRIRGAYRIGDVDQREGSVYYSSLHEGSWDQFSDGKWTQLWLTAQTPWGILVLGKRPLAWGMGLTYDGSDDYGQQSWEAAALSANYGPMRFVIGFREAQPVGLSPDFANKSANYTYDWTGAVIYSCGPLQCGTLWMFNSFHIAPEAGPSIAADADYLLQSHYIKYCNGRFFLNSEYANTSGVYRTVQGTIDLQHQRFALELGCLTGPLKVSGIFGWVDGGIWGNTSYSDPPLANGVVFAPYSMLFVRNYGSGVDAFFGPNEWEGDLSDALFVGVRADYSIAANLNTWLSFSTARRASRNRWRWGCLRPGVSGNVGVSTNPNLPPPIPNDDLGWEIDAGLDWQLLEGLRLTNEFGLYQPGLWYRHACRSLTNPSWAVPNASATNNYGIDPNRTIDPVFAWILTVTGEF